MLPPGFDELDPELDLFYRIETDGSVLVAGEKKRCLIKTTLPDGSVVQGGINNAGALFGERIRGTQRWPLRWQDPIRSTAPGTRLAPREQKRGGINDPMFDPGSPIPARRAATPKPTPPPTALPETAAVMRDLGAAVRSQITEARSPKKETREEMMKRFVKADPKKAASAPTASVPSVSIAMLEEVATAIEQTQAEVERVRADNAAVFEHTHQLEAENQQLRAELENLRETAKRKLAELEAEWRRKVSVRRWSVEEVRTDEFAVEGLEARKWDVEDPEGAIQYLVVATVPAGTAESVTKSWMDDLKLRVDLMPFGGRAVYITKRDNTRLEVLELIPGVDAGVVETSTQF